MPSMGGNFSSKFIQDDNQLTSLSTPPAGLSGVLVQLCISRAAHPWLSDSRNDIIQLGRPLTTYRSLLSSLISTAKCGLLAALCLSVQRDMRFLCQADCSYRANYLGLAFGWELLVLSLTGLVSKNNC
ncbi:hypothetical protein AVEN_121781-1 [Araneus ventricosus]|uniref:Uncharacterized protein n=1 Tax=Araneus ventricosus TaxID=182803 RepID=A0A4Y2I8G9_ARAVE|nr:hypothetical protein AVEN_121781-1 [Araneus ventricosus]